MDKEFLEELKSETSSDFQHVLKALCMGAADYDAYEVHRAIKGLGTDEDALIEILCTRTNAQIQHVQQVYKAGALTSLMLLAI